MSFGAKEFISEPKSVMFACMGSMLKELWCFDTWNWLKNELWTKTIYFRITKCNVCVHALNFARGLMFWHLKMAKKSALEQKSLFQSQNNVICACMDSILQDVWCLLGSYHYHQNSFWKQKYIMFTFWI